jgi:hypothetical protein
MSIAATYARIFSTVDLFGVPSRADLMSYTSSELQRYRDSMASLYRVVVQRNQDGNLDRMVSKLIETLQIIDTVMNELDNDDMIDRALDSPEYWSDF